MTVRDRFLASVLISGLLAGCASGPLGERPEVTAPLAPDPSSIEVAVTFALRDADRTTCSVRIEYSTDGGATWHDATIVSSSAGVVTGKGSVTGIRTSEAYSQITVLWDSWTDNVGKGGAGGEPVRLRVTPSDGDGVGAPAASAAPFDVDNWLAKMEIQPPASVAFEHGLKNALNPADGSFTIVDAVTAPVDLLWEITDISYSPGGTDWITAPIAGVTSGTATAGGGTSDVTVSVDASPGGVDLPPGVYTAVITVGDTNVPSAYGSPKTVTVTLTVSRPVMSLQPASVTFDEVAYNLAPTPGDKTFTIYNDGPPYTELYWVIDDSAAAWLTVTDPVAKSGMITGGSSQVVTLSADQLSPTIQTVGTHPFALSVDDNAGAGVPSRTVDVTLQVRNQRPEILIHDGTGTPFPGDIFFVSCVEGTATSDYFSIMNDGEPVSLLDWDLSEGAGWLTCTPVLGGPLAATLSDSVTVDVTTATLSPVLGVTADYTATITVSGGDDTLGEPTISGVDRQLVVELDVLKQPQIDPTPAGVVFPDGVWGNPYPIGSFVDVDIYNITGEVDLDWTGNWYLTTPAWVTVSAALPASGQVDKGGSDSDTLRFTLDADAAILGIGDHTATFRFVNQYGTPTDLPVSFHVGYRDLIVESIIHSPMSPDPGDNVTFTVTVRNQGDVNAGAFTLGFWPSRFGAPLISTTPYDAAVVAGPVAGGVVTRNFIYTTPSTGTRYAWAFADRGTGTSPADVIESNEGNNAGPTPSGHAWTTVSAPAGDSYEDDDNFAQANLITDGVAQTHSIHEGTDEDYVRFYVSAGTIITAWTNGPSGDTVIYLYNESYTQVAYDDDGGIPPWWSSITYNATTAGWYYVRVRSWGSGIIPSYTLTVTY